MSLLLFLGKRRVLKRSILKQSSERIQGLAMDRMIMKDLAFLLTVLLCSTMIAVEAPPLLPEAGSVSSTNATYDGNALILTGHVILDHGLGKMTAEEASLQKQEMGKDFPFSVIELRKDVHLALKSSAELLCERADLNFDVLTGVLHAKEGAKVIYSDTF